MTCFNWINILSAFLTPTVAIFGAIIAFGQYRINDKKRKNELFDRRYKFYQSAEKFWLQSLSNENRPHDIEDLIPFSMEARMLFGKDIEKHIYQNINLLIP